MARTKGNPNNVKIKANPKVSVSLSTHTGKVTWLPADGAAKLTKDERNELCRKVIVEANAWGFLPRDPNPDGTHPEENVMAVWKKLFGGTGQ
jgi:hypothetical protein